MKPGNQQPLIADLPVVKRKPQASSDPLELLENFKVYLRKEDVWAIEMRDGVAFVHVREETFKVEPQNLVLF